MPEMNSFGRIRGRCLCRGYLAAWLLLGIAVAAQGQGVQCDPSKVVTAAACAQCHANEVQVWQQTPHHATFDTLSRSPRAKEICDRMGLKSVKRSDVCIDCHYTLQQTDGKTRPVSGISCESCHGPAADWLIQHNDYGGVNVTKETETPQHRADRLSACEALGMRNTQDLYAIASSCLNCHTVPNEELVNVGDHKPGTTTFELVAWSQGMVRHNFLRGNNQQNVENSPERLRVMYLIGIIADLEYSTRATALATSKSKYGMAVAQRAADKAIELYQINQRINHPFVDQILRHFAEAQLKINNPTQLTDIANQIQSLGKRLAKECNGSELAAIDSLLPDASQYKWQSSR